MTGWDTKRVAVIGLGDTGLSAVRWLKAQGAQLTVLDTRAQPPGLAQLQAFDPTMVCHCGPLSTALLQSMDMLVVSPGVALTTPEIAAALAAGVEVVGDIELFARALPTEAKVIAITGSNGKTTVTTLVGEICQQAGLRTVVAGNIGLPILDTLQQPAADVYVLELSSFQLETTHSLRVDAATVLNLSEDHMDRYVDMQAYAQAKARIYRHARLAVVNRDDALSAALAQGVPQVSFGLNDAKTAQDFGYVAGQCMQGSQAWLASADMRLRGLHNVANALAAAALCQAIGIPLAQIADTLRQFKGLPHRVEWVAEIQGVDYYDDSKGTNVGATCAAIEGMVKHGKPQPVVLIAGGDGKGQDFSPLQAAVAHNARAVVLIGRDGPRIGAVLQATGVPLHHATELPSAVQLAQTLAQPGDAVLLSPACASFDMFRNYAHRAEVFVQAVRTLEATC